MATMTRTLKDYPPPKESSRLVIAGGSRFASAVDERQVAFPFLHTPGDGPVHYEDACCTVRTSPPNDEQGSVGEEFVMQGEDDNLCVYPALSDELLRGCAPGAEGGVTHREFVASKVVQKIVMSRPPGLFARYVVHDGLCHDPRSRAPREELTAAFSKFKIGMLFSELLDKTRGHDGVDEQGRPFFLGEAAADEEAVGALVFLLRPGVDEASVRVGQLRGLQDSQPYVLNQMTKADIALLPKTDTFFAKYTSASYKPLDIDALHKQSKAEHPDDSSKWIFGPAFRMCEDDSGDTWEVYPAVSCKKACFGFLSDPPESSEDAQTLARILKCVSEPHKAFASVAVPPRLQEASQLAKRKAMEDKLEAAEAEVAHWREKFEQGRDALVDKDAELKQALRASKRIKRDEVATVECGCHLVAAPGSEVYLKQQGADKPPLLLSLPAQVFIPCMPAAMPEF